MRELILKAEVNEQGTLNGFVQDDERFRRRTTARRREGLRDMPIDIHSFAITATTTQIGHIMPAVDSHAGVHRSHRLAKHFVGYQSVACRSDAIPPKLTKCILAHSMRFLAAALFCMCAARDFPDPIQCRLLFKIGFAEPSHRAHSDGFVLRVGVIADQHDRSRRFDVKQIFYDLQS